MNPSKEAIEAADKIIMKLLPIQEVVKAKYYPILQDCARIIQDSIVAPLEAQLAEKDRRIGELEEKIQDIMENTDYSDWIG